MDGYTRGGRIYPGWTDIPGVDGYTRGGRIYPGWTDIPGTDGYTRGGRIYPGWTDMPGVGWGNFGDMLVPMFIYLLVHKLARSRGMWVIKYTHFRGI